VLRPCGSKTQKHHLRHKNHVDVPQPRPAVPQHPQAYDPPPAQKIPSPLSRRHEFRVRQFSKIRAILSDTRCSPLQRPRRPQRLANRHVAKSPAIGVSPWRSAWSGHRRQRLPRMAQLRQNVKLNVSVSATTKHQVLGRDVNNRVKHGVLFSFFVTCLESASEIKTPPAPPTVRFANQLLVKQAAHRLAKSGAKSG